MRGIIAAIALLLGGSPAFAATIAIELPGDEKPQTEKVTYACGGKSVTATYINTSDNQLAVLDLGDRTVIAVSVLAGSGARYVGRQYEWWSKGDDALFTDLTQAPPAPVTCTSAK